MHQLLLSADTAVYVPLLIHSLAVAKNRATVLAAVIRQLTAAGVPLGNSESVISYPIQCAEPWARFQPGQIGGKNSHYYQAATDNAGGGSTCAP